MGYLFLSFSNLDAGPFLHLRDVNTQRSPLRRRKGEEVGGEPGCGLVAQVMVDGPHCGPLWPLAALPSLRPDPSSGRL